MNSNYKKNKKNFQKKKKALDEQKRIISEKIKEEEQKKIIHALKDVQNLQLKIALD